MKDQIIPYGTISSSEELGSMIRYKRKLDGLTQFEAASLCGVGRRVLSEVERGKKSAEIGKVLQIIYGLGLELSVTPRRSRF
ncbi:MAG: helix-turn-helix transcriptional regulator [Deltaproteobacteria bacterium]|nr:helix-turn-helix transcriptional regulator [Deltaproteobacteria bacterium]